MTWALFDYQKYHKITVLQHRSVCYTIPRLPFVCDLHHQLAYTNVHGIEKAYNNWLYLPANFSNLISAKQLEQPASANEVMKKTEYACLFDNECDQIDGDMITGIVGNVRKFLKIYSWKVYERWFGVSESCSKTNLLALVVIDGVVNDARKIPYVRLHTGWPLAKVIEDLVDDVGYALKEYYELNGEQRDHSVPPYVTNKYES
ncbi:hypothetical protein CRE_21560 [Caenorhabditis remanei]|uniref:Uncharacterized protein n=1 Tax=Caenorhabditis remanei TaxID=31234 RepID=E3NFP3_CAERE|nr:hypothetical protein CRE_21560 [Caenorhabditis remanei]